MSRNNAVLLKKIDALVEKYNLLAAERGMPKIPYPSYGSSINNISSSFLVRDLNAISNAVKEIEEIPFEKKKPPKTAKGIKFTEGIISELPDFSAWKDEEGLWYYIKDGENICVYADTGKMIERMNGGAELTLNYADMPYEVLVDTDGKEWKVNSYTVHGAEQAGIIASFGLFGYRDDDDWFVSVIGKLTSLTLQDWTNRNVTDMADMFYQCAALTTLNLSNFSTEKVENMAFMFGGCIGLSTLDVSNFNTNAVKNMDSMFMSCSGLTALNLSNFNTDKVENMKGMFHNCFELTELDLSGFNTGAVTVMTDMFSECPALTRLILGASFNVPSNYGSEEMITNLAPSAKCAITMNKTMYDVFSNNDLETYTFDPDTWTGPIKSVQEITVIPLKIITNVEFTEKTIVPGLPKFYVWKDELWYYAKIEDDICVYADTNAIKDKISNGTLTLNYKDMPYEMLVDSEGNEWKVNSYTVGISVVNEKGESTTLYAGLFGNRNGGYDDVWVNEVIGELTSLTLENWTNRNVTDMACMFYECSKLTSLNLSSFNTEAVTNMANMFAYCSALTDLTLGASFNVPSNYGYPFATTSLAPAAKCNITMNENMYNALKKYDLASYTFYQDQWNESGGTVQEITVIPLKIFMDVEFTTMNISGLLGDVNAWKESNDSLWYYIKDIDDNICVYADTNAIKNKISNGILTLNYKDMPYEMLVDKSSVEWNVTRYNVDALVEPNRVSKYGLFSYREKFNDEWNSKVIGELTSLTLQGWTNRNVTNMAIMFSHCSKLTELDLSSFNTEKVVTMDRMFAVCSELTDINLGENFNTDKVENMAIMFSHCSKLTELDLSSFNTEKVVTMDRMFAVCDALTTLTLGASFNVPSNYGGEYTTTGLAPRNTCTITMNENMYNALKKYDLTDYTFTPDAWTGPSDEIQEITVTLPPQST